MLVNKAVIPIIICSILFSCRSKDDPDNYYDERYYQKALIIGDSSNSLNEGYEVFIYTLDTSRKMLKYYWNNGHIQAISFYYRGKKDGKWIGYFENGGVSFEGWFLNGKKEGRHKIYFPNGRISIVENYKHGKKVGIWSYYDTLGNLIKTENY